MNIHDYRTIYWGHNHFMEAKADGTYRGHCIDSVVFNVGDEIIWNTAYGSATLTVTSVERLRDPSDMYMIEATVVSRAVKQSHIDAHGEPPFEYEVI